MMATSILKRSLKIIDSYKGFTIQRKLREQQTRGGHFGSPYWYFFKSPTYVYAGSRASKDEAKFAIDSYLRGLDA